MTYREFYEQLLGRALPTGDGDVSTQCFCHEDERASCSINLQNGLWFCHSTGNGGNAQQAYEKVKGVGKAAAKKAVAKVEGSDVEPKSAKRKVDPIPQSVCDTYVRDLIADNEKRTYALKHFGWSDQTLRRFKIGLHARSERYTIPVYDEDRNLVNIRMYSSTEKGTAKMVSWKSGYGDARLFPIESLEADTVIIVEGEKDCILMNQVLSDNGVSDTAAVTGTGGAGTWRDAWNEKFNGKHVVIIYDKDTAGIDNAKKVAKKLITLALSVKVVTLDISEPSDADVTNYFVDSSKGWDDLQALIEETQYFTQDGKRAQVVKDDTVYKPHLAEASSERYVGKRLQMKVIVAGKDLAPFIVPKRINFDCDISAGSLCKNCISSTNNGHVSLEYSKDDTELIELIRISDEHQEDLLRKRANVNTKCRVVDTTITEYMNMEEATFVPEIDFVDADREYVSRTAYVMDHGVRTNTSYLVNGTVLPHPKTQQSVHHIPDIQTAQDNIDTFKMDDNKFRRLKQFQPKDGQTIESKFDEIAVDLSTNITRIYGREDLVKAIDLCYHTVLAFEFQGKPVEKAWGDVLILGDTRTGKTETLQALIRHYRMGELALGENMSFAGLVGGLRQEAGKRWSITWGKVPLNDRRLLAIDETSGLGLDALGQLSGIRSNGVAEMTKIMTQRTTARTRLIMLSNPRADKRLSHYAHGVEAVKELIGRPEDIARFDFAVAVATDEVPIEKINAFKQSHVEHVYTSDLCRLLLLWTWSRKPEDVLFSEEATRTVLRLATEQSQKYSADIPLVEGGSHRIKLAKLAVSAACRTFSTGDGQTVSVQPRHVEFAAKFLDEAYAKPSLDYYGFSELANSRNAVSQKIEEEAQEWVTDHRDWAEVWLNNAELRIDDFKTQFDLETKEVRAEIFKPLGKLRMIERGRGGSYVKTPPFITLLKQSKNGTRSNGNHALKKEEEAVAAAKDDFPF